MATTIVGTQSSLMLPQLHAHFKLTVKGPSVINYRGSTTICSFYKPTASIRTISASTFTPHNLRLHNALVTSRISRASSIDINVPGETVLDSTGGGGDEGSGKDGSGGGGGGGDDNGETRGDEDNSKRSKALLMSQKFTLAFAALVGLGGVMGYLKSGSQKSLLSGGLSALLLYYVYTELPKRPVFASAVGLGLSAALLVVMGTRFKKSGKIFPAGVVSAVSLIMTGGYLHGLMKTH